MDLDDLHFGGGLFHLLHKLAQVLKTTDRDPGFRHFPQGICAQASL